MNARRFRRVASSLASLVACAVLIGCGPARRAAPSASATPQPSGGILAPVDRTRDVVDKLNEQQRQTEQRSGSVSP